MMQRFLVDSCRLVGDKRRPVCRDAVFGIEGRQVSLRSSYPRASAHEVGFSGCGLIMPECVRQLPRILFLGTWSPEPLVPLWGLLWKQIRCVESGRSVRCASQRAK